MSRILLLAVPPQVRPSLGERRVGWQNVAIIAGIRSWTIQIAQPIDIAVAILGIWAVDGLFAENHCRETVLAYN